MWSSYVAGHLQVARRPRLKHLRGAPYHPMTQGKIERWHQPLNNRILLENYYLPGDLEGPDESLCRRLQPPFATTRASTVSTAPTHHTGRTRKDQTTDIGNRRFVHISCTLPDFAKPMCQSLLNLPSPVVPKLRRRTLRLHHPMAEVH